MHQKILERILAQEPIQYLTPGSTPVISFGDFTTATLATLSINPSSQEFLRRNSLELLDSGEKRLVDKQTLGIGIDEALREEHAERIWLGCKNYFTPAGNPLRWFDDLDLFLRDFNRGYGDGRSCHLDLVQWATSPAWAELPVQTQKDLIEKDYDFFEWQVSQQNIEALIVNGGTAFKTLSTVKGFQVKIVERLVFLCGTKKKHTSLFEGTGPHGKKVMGWTIPFGKLHVTNVERERIYSELRGWLSGRL